MYSNHPPHRTSPPVQRNGTPIWAAAVGGAAAVVGIGYGAFLLAYASARENGTPFSQTVTGTPLLLAGMEAMLLVLLAVVVLAVIAIVLGIVTVRRRRAASAGWVAIILGAIAPWLTLIGVVRVVLVSFTWM